MLPKVVISVLTYRLTATIWKEPEGYVARCSELGVASAGDSPSDALINLKEATELYLENVKALGMIDDLEDALAGRGSRDPRRWWPDPTCAESVG
jgi:predicted RNase H-like HicB family nuclease